MFSLIPTRSQWQRWSLPSKLTAIGTLVGSLGLCLYLVEKSLPLLFNKENHVGSETDPRSRFCTFSSGTAFSVGYGENLKLTVVPAF
jgi:hypothetical protein